MIYNDNRRYNYCTEKGAVLNTAFTPAQIFEFVARQFQYLEPFAKIFIWKSRRWLAEIVSSYDEKYIWTLGHGRVLIDDVVPFIHETKDLFGTTDRSLAIKIHKYKNSKDFMWVYK